VEKLKVGLMAVALAISGFLATNSNASAEEMNYDGYRELTIIKGVHTYDNRAYATGACSDQYVTGYYFALQSQYRLDYSLVNIVEYDGQQFELSFPSKHVLLTVHLVEQGETDWVQENGQWVYYNPTTGKKHIGWLLDSYTKKILYISG
jgi:glucan-binding YG repeat protein